MQKICAGLMALWRTWTVTMLLCSLILAVGYYGISRGGPLTTLETLGLSFSLHAMVEWRHGPSWSKKRKPQRRERLRLE